VLGAVNILLVSIFVFVCAPGRCAGGLLDLAASAARTAEEGRPPRGLTEINDLNFDKLITGRNSWVVLVHSPKCDPAPKTHSCDVERALREFCQLQRPANLPRAHMHDVARADVSSANGAAASRVRRPFPLWRG
jgi:hypothetical protein